MFGPIALARQLTQRNQFGLIAGMVLAMAAYAAIWSAAQLQPRFRSALRACRPVRPGSASQPLPENSHWGGAAKAEEVLRCESGKGIQTGA